MRPLKAQERTAEMLARIDNALLNHGARLSPERLLELVKQKEEKAARKR